MCLGCVVFFFRRRACFAPGWRIGTEKNTWVCWMLDGSKINNQTPVEEHTHQGGHDTLRVVYEYIYIHNYILVGVWVLVAYRWILYENQANKQKTEKKSIDLLPTKLPTRFSCTRYRLFNSAAWGRAWLRLFWPPLHTLHIILASRAFLAWGGGWDPLRLFDITQLIDIPGSR